MGGCVCSAFPCKARESRSEELQEATCCASCPVLVPPRAPALSARSLREPLERPSGGLPEQTIARLANACDRLQPGRVCVPRPPPQTLIVILQPSGITSFGSSLVASYPKTPSVRTPLTHVSFQQRPSVLFPAAPGLFLPEMGARSPCVSGSQCDPRLCHLLSLGTQTLCVSFSGLIPPPPHATSSTRLGAPPMTGLPFRKQ